MGHLGYPKVAFSRSSRLEFSSVWKASCVWTTVVIISLEFWIGLKVMARFVVEIGRILGGTNTRFGPNGTVGTHDSLTRWMVRSAPGCSAPHNNYKS